MFADFRASSEFGNSYSWDLEFTPSGDALYVCVGVRHYISRVDTKTHAITQVTESPPADWIALLKFSLQSPSVIAIDPVQRVCFVTNSGGTGTGIRRLDLSTGLHACVEGPTGFANGIDVLTSDGVLITSDSITKDVYAVRPKERAVVSGAHRFVLPIA